jgi:hypothetical protein
MNQLATQQKPDLAIEMKAQMMFGMKALRELKMLIKSRPAADKLIVNGKQYLFFYDWQMLGAFFGITPYIMHTEEITQEKPILDGKLTVREVIGYRARAVAFRDGKEISAADAMCLAEEKNWGKKDRFQLLSMAQTRACAKVLRNVLQWVVKLPDEKNLGPEIGEESAEEIQQEMKVQ